MYDRCRHIRVDGARCRAMAINGKTFCYFHLHHRRRKPAPPPKPTAVDYGAIPVNAPAAQTALDLDLPLLEDRYAIQIGITQIARALTANEIDAKRAGLLLYALQIASSNLGGYSCLLPEDVRQVVLTTSGDEIAPATTIFEKEDLSGHKKNCRCDECTYVQTDSEAHHADCSCSDCRSTIAKDEERVTRVPDGEVEGTINLQARADDQSTATGRVVTLTLNEVKRKVLPFDCTGSTLRKATGIRLAEPTSRSSPGRTPRSGRRNRVSAL